MLRAEAPTEPIVRTFSALRAEELYGIMQLRSQVFVLEQNCLFLDPDGVDTLPETLHGFHPRPPRAMADTHGAEFGRELGPWAYARILPAEVPDGPAARRGARPGVGPQTAARHHRPLLRSAPDTQRAVTSRGSLHLVRVHRQRLALLRGRDRTHPHAAPRLNSRFSSVRPSSVLARAQLS